MNNISHLLGKEFKYYPAQTLFEPDLSLIKEGLCPLCFGKLKQPIGRKILICASKKHAKPFIKKLSPATI